MRRYIILQLTLAIAIATGTEEVSSGQIVRTSVNVTGTSAEQFDAILGLVEPQQIGIDFVHHDGSTGKRYVVETILGGLASFDYDSDGCVDVYFLSGCTLGPDINRPTAQAFSSPNKPGQNRLYRNLGKGTFVDTTNNSGLGDWSYGLGVVTADFNNDGFQDVFVSNFGLNRFFVNQGDGSFLEQAETCGILGSERVGAGACFLDIDNDGNLDLYAASYIRFAYSDHRTRIVNGKEFHTGPNDYAPFPDYLYRNNGQGGFTDISEVSGVLRKTAPGMGVISADFNGDGLADIFVANDQQPNFMLVNHGENRFEFEELLRGVAFDRNGHANGSMGVEFGDVGGKLMSGIFVTTYQEEMPVFYKPLGEGLYSDGTTQAKIDPSLKAHVKWGLGLVDFDHDSDLDLFIANGHFLDNLRFIDDRTNVNVANYLLSNDGSGRFANVSSKAGTGLQPIESSRGAVFDDFDLNGTMDGLILNVNQRPTVFFTSVTQESFTLQLHLVGTNCNRDAVGAIAIATDKSGKRQMRIVHSGRGYQSDYGRTLHFGSRQPFTEVEIRWPAGKPERRKVEGSKLTFVQE